MYKRIILNLILVLLLAVLQLGFVDGLPGFWANLNLIIVFLVYSLILSGSRLAFGLSIGFGLLLSVYSFSPFGTQIVSLLATMLVTNFLLINFFTNRSLYSFLLLTLFASFLNEALLFLFISANSFFIQEELFLKVSTAYLTNKFCGFGLNVLLALIVFYVFNFASKKLRPVFLSRYK